MTTDTGSPVLPSVYMVSPQLIDYIRRQRSAGVSNEDITKALIATGWQEPAVQEAFAALPTFPEQTATQAVLVPQQSPVIAGEPKSHRGLWIGIIGGVVLLVLAGAAYAAYALGLLTDLGLGSPTPSDTPEPVATSTFPVASTTIPTPSVSTPAATSTQSAATSTPATFTPYPVAATSSATSSASQGHAAPLACALRDCLVVNFATCSPATFTSSDSVLGTVTYTIIGPVNGGCSMSLVFTKSLTTAWVQKPMTCTYDQKLAFDTAVQNVFTAVQQGKSSCVGPLVALLKTAAK